MTSRVSNRAVTNKNDYVTCIARYLSCVSSAQSTFKGVQWKYIAWLVELSSNVVLKERLTKKEWKDTYTSAEISDSLCRPMRTRFYSLWKWNLDRKNFPASKPNAEFWHLRGALKNIL